MMKAYNRRAACAYAEQWALGRNPEYADFSGMGGDCANFASQCLYAGCGIMNGTPDTGWYYRGMADRSPAWSGARFLCRFLLRRGGAGPLGRETGIDGLEAGDLVFLDNGRGIYHVVVVAQPGGNPLVAAHTDDVWLRLLDSYRAARLRPVHIAGVLTGREAVL